MPTVGVSIAVLLAVSALPGDDAAVLRQAEEAFHAGATGSASDAPTLFRQSAERYEELRRRGYESVSLFRNQGNAYLLADEVPQAILAYRRGLRLVPGDAELQAGLAHARARVLYPNAENFARPPVEHWPPALPRPALGTLLALTTLMYSLACLGVARWYMLRRPAALRFALAVFVLTGLPAAAVVYTCLERRDAVEHPLVVVAEDDVLLRKGPGNSYPKRSDQPLNRGIEAQKHFERGGWLQVQLASGEVGWLPRDAVLVDD